MWNYLAKTEKPIVLYGMGDGAVKIMSALARFGVEISGVFASDEFVRGQSFRGFRVQKYSYFEEKFKNFIILCCFGTRSDAVLANMRELAEKQELFAPDVPVFGTGLFTKEYRENNAKNLDTVYNLLADDVSKKVFDCCVNYRVTGKTDYLTKCETDSKEAYLNILKPSRGETFVDLGAYNGDTVLEYIKFAPDYRKIIAVEPDKKSYNKLIRNTSGLRDIKAVNKGICDTEGERLFSNAGGRQSTLDKGTKTVPVTTVDKLPGGEVPSLIKFDVEGSEVAAINGAANTIKTHRPKMQIAAYHRTDDYFDIPLAVLANRADYKVYMRHYKYIPAWDTQFYFV